MRKVSRSVKLPRPHKEKLKKLSEARNKSMGSVLDDAIQSVTGEDLGKAIASRYVNGVAVCKDTVTSSLQFNPITLDRLDYLSEVTGISRDTIFQLVIEVV